MAAQLNVLTFNCWAIEYLSKNKYNRIRMIAQELNRCDFDIVGLQEIWNSHDYDYLKEAVSETLPHSHYFHNGVIGTGLAIFTKYPITDAYFQPFTFSGYFWRVQHGDWYLGKGIGSTVIQHPLGQIHFVNTHLHADYSDDTYTAIRTLHAQQLLQMLRHTTRDGDHIILCGDLNTLAGEVGMRAIATIGQLNDAYISAKEKPRELFTLDRERNTYAPRDEASKRIDYVWHSRNFLCHSCQLDMQVDAATGQHFSDHFGVSVTLEMKPNTIKRSQESVCNGFTKPVYNSPASVAILEEMHNEIKLGLSFANSFSWLKILILLTVFIGVVCVPVFAPTWGLDRHIPLARWIGQSESLSFILLLQIACMMTFAAYVISYTIMHRIERNTFRNALAEIEFQLNSPTQS